MKARIGRKLKSIKLSEEFTSELIELFKTNPLSKIKVKSSSELLEDLTKYESEGKSLQDWFNTILPEENAKGKFINSWVTYLKEECNHIEEYVVVQKPKSGTPRKRRSKSSVPVVQAVLPFQFTRNEDDKLVDDYGEILRDHLIYSKTIEDPETWKVMNPRSFRDHGFRQEFHPEYAVLYRYEDGIWFQITD